MFQLVAKMDTSTLNEEIVCTWLEEFMSTLPLEHWRDEQKGSSTLRNFPLKELGVDSFTLVEVILHAESKLGARISLERLTSRDLASLSTLSQFVLRELEIGTSQ